MLYVTEDGDEWEGGDLTADDALGWVQHALLRGDKHAWNYTAQGAPTGPVTYEEVGDDE